MALNIKNAHIISKLSVALSIYKSLGENKCFHLLENRAKDELILGIMQFLETLGAWHITF